MKRETSFDSWVHNFGQLSGLVIMIMMILVPVIACTALDMWPDMATLIPVFVSVALMLLPFAVAESIAYPPMLGPGSVYMAYISGNSTSLKIPCALSALNIAGVKQGTTEANAVSLVAIGTSALTVTSIVIIGVLLSGPITPILMSPLLKPGFDNIMPALFGALTGGMMFGQVRYFVIPMAASLFFIYCTHIPMAYFMLLVIAISIVTGFFINKHEKAKLGKL